MEPLYHAFLVIIALSGGTPTIDVRSEFVGTGSEVVASQCRQRAQELVAEDPSILWWTCPWGRGTN